MGNDNIANHVSDHSKIKIYKLKKKFLELSDEFENELINAEPKNIYSPEG